jgi:putative tricarboxylic transport membrane protein
MSEPAPSLLPHEEPLPPRWDLCIAAIFLALGTAIIFAAWAMPTFYERLQQTYTAPGLVPAVYGAIIALLSVWLAMRSLRRGALVRAGTSRAKSGNSNFRLFIAAVICLVYAVGLIGTLPFWLATAIFIAGFIVVFEARDGMSARQWAREAAEALGIGLGAGIVVVLLFEKLFLVRLP